MLRIKFAVVALLVCLFVVAAFAHEERGQQGGDPQGKGGSVETLGKEQFKHIEEGVERLLCSIAEKLEDKKSSHEYRKDDDGLKTLELDFDLNVYALIKK